MTHKSTAVAALHGGLGRTDFWVSSQCSLVLDGPKCEMRTSLILRDDGLSGYATYYSKFCPEIRQKGCWLLQVTLSVVSNMETRNCRHARLVSTEIFQLGSQAGHATPTREPLLDISVANSCIFPGPKSTQIQNKFRKKF